MSEIYFRNYTLLHALLYMALLNQKKKAFYWRLQKGKFLKGLALHSTKANITMEQGICPWMFNFLIVRPKSVSHKQTKAKKAYKDESHL